MGPGLAVRAANRDDKTAGVVEDGTIRFERKPIVQKRNIRETSRW
jgi:hypothetical protein